MDTSLKHRTLDNLALTAAARLLTLVLQLGANVVLARSLTSADYGIVGYAQIFISFLSLVSEFGLNSAAIQRPQLSVAALHTGFTLRMLLGLAAFGLALAVAPLAAQSLGEPAVADVVRLLAVGFLINGLAFMPSVRALRQLDYAKYTAAQVAGSVVNAGVTVWMALAGFAYWSIVLANVAAIGASALLLNLLIRQPMRLVLDPDSTRHYAQFGGHLFLSWMLTFVIMNLDNLVIGTLLGSATLGYYALAFGWGTKWCEMLGSVINSVLFPTFAKIQSDLPGLRSAYVKSLELVAFLAVGGYVTLFACSADFLYHLLGGGTDKWQPALTTLRILCVYGLLRAMLEPVGSVVMAIGGIAVLVRANLLAAVVKVALIYPALQHFGIAGVAVAVTLSYAAQYLVFLPVLNKQLGLSVSAFLAPQWRLLLSGALTLASLSAIRQAGLLPDDARAFWISAALCSSIYLAVFGLVSRGAAYCEFYHLVRARLSRPSAPAATPP